MLEEFVFATPQAGGETVHADGARIDRAYEVQLPGGAQVVTYLEAAGASGGGPAELVGSWADPAITKHRQGLGFLIPLRAGGAAALRRVADDTFHHRRYEHHQSRRALGLTREQLYLAGDFAVFYIEGENPRAAYAAFAVSTAVHDVWLRVQLHEIFEDGFDLGDPLPPIRTLHDHDLSAVPA